jgi:hypothetical protein
MTSVPITPCVLEYVSALLPGVAIVVALQAPALKFLELHLPLALVIACVVLCI